MRVNIKLQIAVKYEAWIELFSIKDVMGDNRRI